MPLQRQPQHLLLIGGHIHINIHFFARGLNHTIREFNGIGRNRSNCYTFKGVTNNSKGIACFQNEGFCPLLSFLSLEGDRILACNGENFYLFLLFG